jgi:hypothetical protein
MELPLDRLDEDLERCLQHVSFGLVFTFSCYYALSLIDCPLLQSLVLSEKRHEKRATELVHTARNVELEMLAKSQAEKIAKLETTYTDL